jgi:general stress protein 26
MRNPETRLDERFSDPGTEATGWAAAREVLETAQLSWISTVRADGRPHVTPLVAVWLDGAVHFGTGATEQKCVNLTANPHVVLTTGCNTWDDGLDVMVEGEARRVTDRPALERLAVAWLTKWDGSWRYEVTDEGLRQAGNDALVFAVEPAKVLAFGRKRISGEAGPSMLSTVEFTHTSHRPAGA